MTFEEEFPSLTNGFSKSFRPFDFVQQDLIRDYCLDKQRVKETIMKIICRTPIGRENAFPEEFEVRLENEEDFARQLIKELELKGDKKMGSIMRKGKCPYCGYDYGMLDYYYKSGEEYFSCSRCGTYYGRTLTNGDSYSKNNWKPKYEEEEHITKHAFCYGGESGVRSCGGLKHNEIKRFVNIIKKEDKITNATYTFKRNGEWWEKDVITGKVKKFFTEYEKSAEEYENEKRL